MSCIIFQEKKKIEVEGQNSEDASTTKIKRTKKLITLRHSNMEDKKQTKTQVDKKH